VTGKRAAKASRARSRVFGFLFYLALAAALAAALSLRSASSAPRMLLGHAFLRVLSGSMQGELPEGSLIVIRRTAPQKLAIGDNITYIASDGSVITHKIESIVRPSAFGEPPSFVTRGIANPYRDSEPVPAAAVVGKVIFSTMFFARAAAFAKDISGFLLRYPVFLVLFPVLIGATVFSLRVYVTSKPSRRAGEGGTAPPQRG
jgi:signal peptidase I